ncbi:MAG: histidine kinase [Betaproteobacteria bacterium]|nr:histidine kinase [Betaproteobacteria bacterium]
MPQLPDFCNMGIIMRLILLVNALCLAAAIARSPTLDAFTHQFLTLSVVVQPSLILSLPLLCGGRQLLGREPAPARSLGLFLAVAALVAVAGWFLMTRMLSLESQLNGPQYALLYAFVIAAIVLYFDLRARALSPSVTEARLNALQARIRPHFLFNSMNAALSLVRSEPRRAETVIENLAELFRALMNDNRNLVRLDEEVNLCLNYLEIEQIRLGDRLKVKWHIEAMPADTRVPSLLLQPLVENAVYHGIEPADRPGEITIAIEDLGRHVRISLTNPSGPAAGAPHGNRMALANIRERLQLHYDAEATLDLKSGEGLYTVVITLPKKD